MTARSACLSLAVACAVACPSAAGAGDGTVPAYSKIPDRGKKRVVALFADAVAGTSDSVLRILGDGKQVALGTVVSADGYVLTKGSDLKGDLQAVLRDGTKVTARRVGYHKLSDLELLKIDADHLKPVKFETADPAELGNWVAAVGPASDALAAGVVSVPARKLYGDQAWVENSDRGVLGVTLDRGTDPETEDAGVVVGGFGEEMGAKSGAKKAGLRKGDIIVEVAGKPTKSFAALKATLENYTSGETVSVRVMREDKELSFKVKLGGLHDGDRMQNALGGALSNRRTGFPSVIQHDTVIKPAECGGPIVDLDGKVLGINIARAGRVETWALPGTVVAPILKDLLAGKYADKQ